MGGMRFRKLRIAWSVTCAIACALLIALWVDSYWSVRDLKARYYRLEAEINSFRGAVVLDVNVNQTDNSTTIPNVLWVTNTFPLPRDTHTLVPDGLRIFSLLGFRWTSSGSIYEVDFPFWFFALFTGALITFPWLRLSKRFSLRTLLIATTLVAVVLGLAVYVIRR